MRRIGDLKNSAVALIFGTMGAVRVAREPSTNLSLVIAHISHTHLLHAPVIDAESLHSSMGGFGKVIQRLRERTFRLTAAKVSEEPRLTDAAGSSVDRFISEVVS